MSVVQIEATFSAVDHDLMSDGGSGVATSWVGSGAARFGFGPSVGGKVVATKDIVAVVGCYIFFALISNKTTVAFSFIRSAGEEKKFLLSMMTPALQSGSW